MNTPIGSSDGEYAVIVALAVGVSALLAGCERQPSNAMADYRILCSLEGKAFYVRPASADASFIKPQPDADPLCARKP